LIQGSIAGATCSVENKQILKPMIQLDKSEFVQIKECLPTQNVTGFPISALSFDGQVSTMMRWAKGRLSKVVCVSNVHMIMEGHWRPEFSQVLLGADLLTPDGMPLVWLTSLMKRKPQDRVAGMELMLALCERAQALGVSLFLLGSTPEMLAQIRQQLSHDFPGLQVVGIVSPPFRELSEEEDRAIVNQIRMSGAGLVFVSLGCPKQEHWMFTHRDKVQAVMVGLGGAFSVYAGATQWAPAWVRKYGLEWLYRLLQEPGRLWKRYAITIPPFLWLAFKQVLKVRLGISPDISLREKYLGFSRSCD
jgi:N-acetylglucosaminyldiphosphoundecaprenol N-acetyl-beta-D-mannosaminyltransferase